MKVSTHAGCVHHELESVTSNSLATCHRVAHPLHGVLATQLGALHHLVKGLGKKHPTPEKTGSVLEAAYITLHLLLGASGAIRQLAHPKRYVDSGHHYSRHVQFERTRQV